MVYEIYVYYVNIQRYNLCLRLTSPDFVNTGITDRCQTTSGEENQSTEKQTAQCGSWFCKHCNHSTWILYSE